MTGLLLDTNVVSESTKRNPNPAARAWLSSHRDAETWISVLTLGELRRGAARLETSDPARAAGIAAWVDDTEVAFEGRILDVDRRVAAHWVRLTAGRTLPVVDSLIVATAAVHGLALVTRNVKDMAGHGVDVINPWEA